MYIMRILQRILLVSLKKVAGKWEVMLKLIKIFLEWHVPQILTNTELQYNFILPADFEYFATNLLVES